MIQVNSGDKTCLKQMWKKNPCERIRSPSQPWDPLEAEAKAGSRCGHLSAKSKCKALGGRAAGCKVGGMQGSDVVHRTTSLRRSRSHGSLFMGHSGLLWKGLQGSHTSEWSPEETQGWWCLPGSLPPPLPAALSHPSIHRDLTPYTFLCANGYPKARRQAPGLGIWYKSERKGTWGSNREDGEREEVGEREEEGANLKRLVSRTINITSW